MFTILRYSFLIYGDNFFNLNAHYNPLSPVEKRGIPGTLCSFRRLIVVPLVKHPGLN